MSEQADGPDQEQPLAGRQIGYLLEAPDRVGANLAQQMMALRDLGAEVTAIFMTGDPATASLDGVADHRLGLELPKKALSGMRLRLAWRLRAALRTTSLDTLVCDQYKAVTAAALAQRLGASKPRLYALLRGFQATDSRSRQRVYRLIAGRIHGIIALTARQRHRIAKNLHWYSKERIHIVGNFIDGEQIRRTLLAREEAHSSLNIPEGRLVFGCIARFDPYKRIPDLLKALSKLLEQRTDIHLVIIGDGRERRSIQAEASSLGLDEHLTLTGFLPDAKRFMTAFDVFVLPSEGDNFARVFLEAAAVELPVIGVNGGGTPDVLSPDAELIPRRDVTAFANALRTHCEMSPEQRRQRGLKNRQWTEKRFNRETLRQEILTALR